MTKPLELFLTFLKIGALNFGGGYGMIPFLQAEAIAHDWLTASEFANIVAISQITPGPIAVNMATFVGYTQWGVAGSVIATVAVCLPSFTIFTLLVGFFTKFARTRWMEAVFFGLRPAAVGMILAAAVTMGMQEFAQAAGGSLALTALFAVVAFLAMWKFKVHPILCIVVSAVIGALVF